MPRKKVTEENTPAEPTSEITEKPKRTRKPKVVQTGVSAAEPVSSTPDEDTKPKAKRTSRRLFQKESVAETKPEPTAVPAEDTERKPARATTRRGQKKEIAAIVELPPETPKETAAVAEPVVIDTPSPAREAKPKKRLFGKVEPAASSQPAAEVSTASTEIKKTSRRGKKTVEPTLLPSPEPQKAHGLWDDETDLPIPTWRPRLVAQEDVESSQIEAKPTLNLAPRKSQRNRKGSDERPSTAPAEVDADKPREPKQSRRGQRVQQATPPPAPEPKPAPFMPQQPPINVPDTAPQVVLRDGIPTLVRNGRVYPPMMFFGSSPDEKRAETVLQEIRLAGEGGVHLHGHLIDIEVDTASVSETVGLAAYLLNKTLEADPDGQILFRLSFVPPRGWESKFKNAVYRLADGELADPSVSDDEYWAVARECLVEFVRQMRLVPNNDRVLGLHLDRGEWFQASGTGYDESPAAKQQFREWTKSRYLNDEVALRASWFDGSVKFDSIQIPPYAPEGLEGEKFVRASRKQRRYVDYHLFLSDAMVRRIGDLAYAAKAASEGNFLIGVSYGYTFEWSHPESGHLSLGKLLRTPEIDFIAGPPSYKNREPGGSAPFPCPIDSFALNGKLYLSEEDYKTVLGDRAFEPDDFNPVIKTPQALESVHWRGVGAALAHASGVAWMDVWGNGWLKTLSIWERAAKVRETLIDRMAAQLSDPDVIVFIDERALGYLVDQNAFTLLVQNVRESVLRSGLSAGFYLLSDLAHRERFPEGKLYVFLNAWDIRPELRSAIKTRLQRDNKVLFWLYSAGLFDAGRDSLERAREVTGIALKPQPFFSKSGTTILNRRHPLSEAFPEKGVIAGGKLEPSYFAIPEDATVLGEYTQTGLPSFVIREFKSEEDASLSWNSVFLGEPMVNPALIRALGQMAGGHVWNFQDDIVHARAPFLTVHCTGAGPRTITLPHKCCAYNLLTGQWASNDTSSLRFNAVDGSTHLFMVGVREEIEGILSKDEGDLLKMAQLPPKPEDTRQQDALSFDIPIMKLDEWIEGGVSAEDAAEDWLLRPQLIEEIPSVAEADADRPGRRRRRRRGDRRERGGTEETATARQESADMVFEDLDMSVMFRKRD